MVKAQSTEPGLPIVRQRKKKIQADKSKTSKRTQEKQKSIIRQGKIHGDPFSATAT